MMIMASLWALSDDSLVVVVVVAVLAKDSRNLLVHSPNVDDY